MSRPIRSSNTLNNMNSGYIKTGYIPNISYETDTTIFRPLVNILKNVLNIQSDVLKFRFNTHQDEFYYLYQLTKDSGIKVFTEAKFVIDQEIFPLVGLVDDELDLSDFSIGLGEVELSYNQDSLPLNYEIIDNKLKINSVGVSYVSYTSKDQLATGKLRVVGVHQLPKTFKFYPIINLNGEIIEIETNREYDLRSFFRTRPYELYLKNLVIEENPDVEFISNFKFKSNIDGSFSIKLSLDGITHFIRFKSSSMPTPLIGDLPTSIVSGYLTNDPTNLYHAITPNVEMRGSRVVLNDDLPGFVFAQSPITKEFKIIEVTSSPVQTQEQLDVYNIEYSSNVVLSIDEEKLLSEFVTVTKNSDIVTDYEVSLGSNFSQVADLVSGNRIKAKGVGTGILIIKAGEEVAEITITVMTEY